MKPPVSKICPKCESSMEDGSYSGNAFRWIADTDQGFLQETGKTIISFACTRCGYIENYVRT